VAVAGRDALVGSGAQVSMAFDEHGVVDQERDSLRKAVKASCCLNEKRHRGLEVRGGLFTNALRPVLRAR
jgi:hypothetical protein